MSDIQQPVARAIGDEIACAIERVDEVVRNLRAATHRAELGL